MSSAFAIIALAVRPWGDELKQAAEVLVIDGAVDEQSLRRKARLLTGLLSGASIVVLDFFIVLACLPAIEQTLGATKGQLQLILAVYAVANASLLVVGGRLGDLLGRKRVMMWGVGSFAIASLACGMSTTPLMLIIFRALQGLAGAMVQPQVLGLLAVNFDNQDRGRVFGLYAAALGCAGIVAQLLGGALVGTLPADLGWRACFMVAVPLCVFSMIFASEANDGERSHSQKVDITGAALLGVSLACVCTFLTMGREQGWPAWSFEVFAAGIGSLALLWYWQEAGHRGGEERIIPAGILGQNEFWLSLVTIFVFYAGVASLYFVLALELRVTCGFSPVQVGLLFGWLAVCFVTTSTSKQFKAKVGAYGAEIGLLCLACGHICMYWGGAQSNGYPQVSWFLLSCGLQGAGIGCLMGPLMATALSKVKAQQASVGGGIASAMQQIGNSIGIAAIGFAYFASEADGRPSIGGAVVYLVGMLVLLAALFAVAKRGPKAL